LKKVENFVQRQAIYPACQSNPPLLIKGLLIPHPNLQYTSRKVIKMHILLLGATGRTGTVILSEALSRGHTVTALVRSADSITPRPGLTIVEGSPLDLESLDTAFTSPYCPGSIIVALASVRKSDSPFSPSISPPRLMADTHKNVVTLMKKHKVERVVTLQAFGTGDSRKEVFAPMRWVMECSPMSVGMRDHEMVDQEMKLVMKEQTGKEIKWTGIRACMLSDGEKKEVTSWGNSGKGVGLVPSVSRRSVAGFLVDVVEDGSTKWVGETPVVSD
jgi:hypothetical protein